jgi:hypothetical protein
VSSSLWPSGAPGWMPALLPWPQIQVTTFAHAALILPSAPIEIVMSTWSYSEIAHITVYGIPIAQKYDNIPPQYHFGANSDACQFQAHPLLQPQRNSITENS